MSLRGGVLAVVALVAATGCRGVPVCRASPAQELARFSPPPGAGAVTSLGVMTGGFVVQTHAEAGDRLFRLRDGALAPELVAEGRLGPVLVDGSDVFWAEGDGSLHHQPADGPAQRLTGCPAALQAECDATSKAEGLGDCLCGAFTLEAGPGTLDFETARGRYQVSRGGGEPRLLGAWSPDEPGSGRGLDLSWLPRGRGAPEPSAFGFTPDAALVSQQLDDVVRLLRVSTRRMQVFVEVDAWDRHAPSRLHHVQGDADGPEPILVLAQTPLAQGSFGALVSESGRVVFEHQRVGAAGVDLYRVPWEGGTVEPMACGLTPAALTTDARRAYWLEVSAGGWRLRAAPFTP